VAAGLTELEALRRLGTGPGGLTDGQAEQRWAEHGDNVLPLPRGRSWWRLLGGAARDPYAAVMALLALASAVTGTRTTAAVLALLAGVGCALRMVADRRADRAAVPLRGLTDGTATVLRRAAPEDPPRPREVPLDQLVPGDVVRLSAGDPVPADVMLLRAEGLTVDQAVLTGESSPVPKHPGEPRPQETGGGTGEPRLCFLGTRVAAGSGSALVIGTGTHTRLARAQGRRAGAARGGTAFDRATRSVTAVLVCLTAVALLLSLAVVMGLRGSGWTVALPFAVAVAVGLTPGMLPVVITGALARGAALLRRRQVIVKRLPSVYDLGALDVLCADKTGTLTRGHLAVRLSVDARGRRDPGVLRWAAVNSMVCLELGDPPVLDDLDEALLAAAAPQTHAVDVLPAGPRRRHATAVLRHPERIGEHTLVVKGAVEDVLERCGSVRLGRQVRALDERRRAATARLAARYADRGLRVIAVAAADRQARPGRYRPADERGLTLLGLVGLRDEPEPSASAALAGLAAQGVAVKLVTGDHPATAVGTCRDLDLSPGRIVLGRQLDDLDDAALARLAERTTVFARATPAHKARIVRVLRSGGRTVGFLGDGGNDVPAMAAADLAVCPPTAIGAARRAADVVLSVRDLTALDGNLYTARRSLAAIAGYLRVTLASNLGNVFSMLVAGAVLPFLPMLPGQVLAQNLCFDAAQLALAFDRPLPPGGRPEPVAARVLLRYALLFGVLNSCADLATFAVIGQVTHHLTAPRAQVFFHTGWFTENLLTQALTVQLLRGAGRGAGTPAPWPVGLSNLALAACGLLLPCTPPAAALGFGPLPAAYYLGLAVILAAFTLCLLAGRAAWASWAEATRRRTARAVHHPAADVPAADLPVPGLPGTAFSAVE
jgi:Mg2+-importing ATPase